MGRTSTSTLQTEYLYTFLRCSRRIYHHVMNNSTNRTVQFNCSLIMPPTSPRKNGTLSGPVEVNTVITAPSTSACKLNNSSFSRDSSYLSLLTPPISPTNPGSLAWSESADAWPTLQQRNTRQRPDPIKRELHCKLHSCNPLLEPSSWSICVDGTDDRNLTSTHRRNNSLTTTHDGQETDKFGALSSLIILSSSADESKPEILSEVGILESEEAFVSAIPLLILLALAPEITLIMVLMLLRRLPKIILLIELSLPLAKNEAQFHCPPLLSATLPL